MNDNTQRPPAGPIIIGGLVFRCRGRAGSTYLDYGLARFYAGHPPHLDSSRFTHWPGYGVNVLHGVPVLWTGERALPESFGTWSSLGRTRWRWLPPSPSTPPRRRSAGGSSVPSGGGTDGSRQNPIIPVADYTACWRTPPPLLGAGRGSTNISIIPWAYHDNDPNGGNVHRDLLTYGQHLAARMRVRGLLTAPDAQQRRTATSNTSIRTRPSTRFDTACWQDDHSPAKLTISSVILSTADTLTFTGGDRLRTPRVIHPTSGVSINSIISGRAG